MTRLLIVQVSKWRTLLVAAALLGIAVHAASIAGLWGYALPKEGWEAIKALLLGISGMVLFGGLATILVAQIVIGPRETIVVNDVGIEQNSLFASSKYPWNEISHAISHTYIRLIPQLSIYSKKTGRRALLLQTWLCKQRFAQLVQTVQSHIPVERA